MKRRDQQTANTTKYTCRNSDSATQSDPLSSHAILTFDPFDPNSHQQTLHMIIMCTKFGDSLSLSCCVVTMYDGRQTVHSMRVAYIIHNY